MSAVATRLNRATFFPTFGLNDVSPLLSIKLVTSWCDQAVILIVNELRKCDY